MQGLFAALEHRKMRLLAAKGEANSIFDTEACIATTELKKMTDGVAQVSTVALQISAFEEDPDYLRECLQSIKKLRYPNSKLKIILCIDGNQDKDLYHWSIYKKVFKDDEPK